MLIKQLVNCFIHAFFAIFLLAILVNVSIIMLTDYRFNSLMQQKMSELIIRQQQNAATVDNILTRLSSQLHYDCGKQDKSLLQQEYRDNPFIRVIGMITDDKRSCSTLGDSYKPDFKQLLLTHQNHEMNYYQGALHSQLVLNLHSDKGNLYMIFNSPGGIYIADRPCTDCFFIKTNLNNNEITKTGHEDIVHENNAKKIVRISNQVGNKIILWAGNNLFQYSRQWAINTTIFSGIIFSIIIIIFFFWKRRQQSLNQMLQQGISQKEFKPLYQPIVDARSGYTVGYEALIRWYHKKQCIPPSTFIDFAESSNLIIPMTEQLIKQVIKDLPKLPAGTWVSINIVASHLETEILTNLLKELNYPSPRRLHFELTERQPIIDTENAAKQISQLNKYGYRIKIDDFGTGFGGISCLQQLDITTIKIDKMFIDTIGTDDFKAGVLNSLIRFGHDFKLEMIAEGVENKKQADYLLQQGVFLHQGYLYSKPDTVKQMQFLDRNRHYQLPVAS
ncbi:diguanylate phosphodiesterase [Shewanella sp. NFH-SH190041]|uniref:EAL domain-containing protein n=1 Tax=Shewanella sp. NFH-SH190041 TaxID=2950245 RepID=UPI0021C445BA|nr:EAL domain-containing protein [Shewanella sp. NFH-SH190041]BDM63282.1 diguanylate phosphodiesterase [Shewanella sp. NFH-SH190041]